MPYKAHYATDRIRLEVTLPEWVHKILVARNSKCLGYAVDQLLTEHEQFLRRHFTPVPKGTREVDTFVSAESHALFKELRKTYGAQATKSKVVTLLCLRILQQMEDHQQAEKKRQNAPYPKPIDGYDFEI